jgi:hypothetical protein
VTPESSGSLTGLILARAQAAAEAEAEAEPKRRRRWLRGLIVGVSIIAFLAVIGGVVYVLAGDFLRSLVHTLTRF